MARKTKKATEVAINTTQYFISRVSTFEVEVGNLTFVMKTLPTPVMSFISGNAMQFDADTKETNFDFNALVLWTCKFAIEDIKGLKAYVYDDEGRIAHDEEGNVKTKDVQITLDTYKLMSRKFPCLSDNILDALPFDALYEAYGKWSDVATVSDEEKQKQDFIIASDTGK